MNVVEFDEQFDPIDFKPLICIDFNIVYFLYILNYLYEILQYTIKNDGFLD